MWINTAAQDGGTETAEGAACWGHSSVTRGRCQYLIWLLSLALKLHFDRIINYPAGSKVGLTTIFGKEAMCACILWKKKKSVFWCEQQSHLVCDHLWKEKIKKGEVGWNTSEHTDIYGMSNTIQREVKECDLLSRTYLIVECRWIFMDQPVIWDLLCEAKVSHYSWAPAALPAHQAVLHRGSKVKHFLLPCVQLYENTASEIQQSCKISNQDSFFFLHIDFQGSLIHKYSDYAGSNRTFNGLQCSK